MIIIRTTRRDSFLLSAESPLKFEDVNDSLRLSLLQFSMAQVVIPGSLWPTAERQALDEVVASTADGLPSNNIFIVDRISAAYVISGAYGYAPRGVFYILIFILAAWRRSILASAALGTVMVYSSTAALHAIALSFLTSQIVPGSNLENYRTVQVKPGIDIPIIPGVVETDTDAVLVVVGVSFLTLVPMAVWSSTFQNAEKKTILVMWGLLLLFGFVSSSISALYVYLWSFLQVRFCPIHINNTLPLQYSGSDLFGGTWNRVDRNYWNDTITMFFQNTTLPRSNVCFYPSMDFTWPLRNPDEIHVSTRSRLVSTATELAIVVSLWTVLVLFTIFSLVVLWLHGPGSYWSREDEKYSIQIKRLMDDIRRQSVSGVNTIGTIAKDMFVLLFHAIDTYAKYLSCFTVLLYVAWGEVLLATDPQGESFNHIGQWGAAATAVLVLLAVIIDELLGYFADMLEFVRLHLSGDPLSPC